MGAPAGAVWGTRMSGNAGLVPARSSDGLVAVPVAGLIAAAVERERRRIARDIHDGLAQDLAFIAARVRVLERDPTAPVRLDHLVGAADRALEHSRTAIASLTRP